MGTRVREDQQASSAEVIDTINAPEHSADSLQLKAQLRAMSYADQAAHLAPARSRSRPPPPRASAAPEARCPTARPSRGPSGATTSPASQPTSAAPQPRPPRASAPAPSP